MLCYRTTCSYSTSSYTNYPTKERITNCSAAPTSEYLNTSHSPIILPISHTRRSPSHTHHPSHFTHISNPQFLALESNHPTIANPNSTSTPPLPNPQHPPLTHPHPNNPPTRAISPSHPFPSASHNSPLSCLNQTSISNITSHSRHPEDMITSV